MGEPEAPTTEPPQEGGLFAPNKHPNEAELGSRRQTAISKIATNKEKVTAAFTGILLTTAMSVPAKKSRTANSRVTRAEMAAQVLSQRLYTHSGRGIKPQFPRARKLAPISGNQVEDEPEREKVNILKITIAKVRSSR